MTTSSFIPQDAPPRQPAVAPSGVRDGAAALSGAAFAEALAARRAQIDAFDAQLLRLLTERTQIVEQVAELKQQQRLSVFMKPGREAQIIRAMLAVNNDALPPRLIAQLWREIMMASLQREQAFAVAAVVGRGGGVGNYVAVREGQGAAPSPLGGEGWGEGVDAHQPPLTQGLTCWQLTRDHFGCVTPIIAAPDIAAALAEVAEGRVLLAVLPDPIDDWWPLLLQCKKPLRLVFRLPFLGGGLGEGAGNAAGREAPANGAWAVGPVPCEASDDDWTFLFLKENLTLSQLQHELAASVIAAWQHDSGTLVALHATLMPDDPWLNRLPGVRHLGVVAVPVAETSTIF